MYESLAEMDLPSGKVNIFSATRHTALSMGEIGFSAYSAYHIMIFVYFTVGSTSSGSAFVIEPNLGAKTIFESISL